MAHIKGKNSGNNIQVDFCGYLNVSNIAPIAEEMLKNAHLPVKSVTFHFEEVKGVDAPAMTMMVITAKNLKGQDIMCRVVGLTPDNLRLAISLGLGMMAKLR